MRTYAAMMMTRSAGLLLLACLAMGWTGWTRAESTRRYVGDKVLRVDVENTERWKQLQGQLEYILPLEDIDVWGEPSVLRQSADIFAPKRHYPAISEMLNDLGMEYSVMIDDIQQLIDNELLENQREHRRKRRNADSLDSLHGVYAELEDIYGWLMYLNSTYPDSVTLLNIGKTYEQRNIYVLKIGSPTERRPAMWLDSAIHAREWLAPATNIYIIEQLLAIKEGSDEAGEEGDDDEKRRLRALVENLDWYILVIANPDGYSFSHTDDRLWRKNRKPTTSKTCKGVDLNRNWDFHWGEASAYPEPCSNMYRGPSPESELETKHMSNFLWGNKDVIQASVSLHTYTQAWFTRWGYTLDVKPVDDDELMNVSIRAVNAIEAVHGMNYGVGRAGELIYLYSGGSPDWAKAVAGIKYSFAIELRDTGRYGHILPPEQIIPTAEEIWPGIQVVAKTVLDRIEPAAHQSSAANMNLCCANCVLTSLYLVWSIIVRSQ